MSRPAIELNNLRSRGKVWVYAGGGDDHIQIIGKRTDISGSLIVSSINGPANFGRAQVFVSGSPVGGVPASTDDWATISGTITINPGTLPPQNFAQVGDHIRVLGVKNVGRLSINTTGDNDFIQLAGVTGNALEIDGGPGDEDTLGSTDGHRPEFSTVSIVGIEQNLSGL